MFKYCKVLDEKTGLVQIGVGCSDEYYKEIGMESRNVQQSDIDGSWYIIDKCPMKTQEQKEQEERERILTLSVTKLDFLKYVCKPNGITYTKLMEIINSNENLQEVWNLCERVYRGDEFLNKYIAEYIPNLTSDELDRIFMEINNYGI